MGAPTRRSSGHAMPSGAYCRGGPASPPVPRRSFPMSRRNKALVRRFVDEVVNRGNKKLLAELVAADHVRHAPDGDLYGREGVRIDIAEWRAGIPDLTLV